MKRSATRLPSAPMLTHFTRASRAGTALDNLVTILNERAVRGATRMVRGKQPVVCLFDAPFGELRHLLDRRNRRRYEPFGIAVDKRYAFKMGARPVIYLPWSEAQKVIAPEQLWRVVTIDMERTPPVDWSFEREWRLHGDLPIEPRQVVALVDNWRDVDEVFLRFGGHPPCAGVIPVSELFGKP
ncbi:MAG TPA: hypothetical protein VMV15_05685 [Candidatus Binataceae bacterium]|nr:hypothetical protein [Candidatus Binataceae bacterium]